MLSEMVVVVGFYVSVFASCGSDAVEVFDADPLVEAMLLDHVVAEVPLAEVSRVVVFADALGDGGAIGGEGDVVAVEAYGVGVKAGHDGGAAGGADGLCDVGVIEDEGLVGDGV